MKRKNNRKNFSPSSKGEFSEHQDSPLPVENSTHESLQAPVSKEPEHPEAPAVTIGDWLKNQRLNKGADLLDISRFTKINPTLLESLENNDFASLPSSTYLRGFVKSYCNYLGANVEEGMEILKKSQTMPGLTELAKKTQYRVRDTTAEHRKQKLKRQMPVLLVTAIFILGAGIVWKTQIATENIDHSNNVILPPSMKEPEKESVKKNVQTEESSVISEVESVPNQTMATGPSDPTTPIKKEETEVSPPPKPSSVSIPEGVQVNPELDKTVVLSSIDAPLYTYSPLTDELKSILPEDNWQSPSGLQKIFIKAVDGDCWVTYKKDDEPIKKFVLSEDKTLQITGKVIRLFMGNVHAARIFHNGKPITTDTKSGVKSLVFPGEKASQYKLPLFHFKEDGTAITTMD